MITILGPTACGKTQLAVALAAKLNADIISADSRQVYRRMDIGTGKDLDDYIYNGVRIPCHLIDICEPGEKYNVYRYQHDFREVYASLQQQQRTAILCGGSGLYIESVLRNYNLPTVPQNPALRQRLEQYSLAELTTMLQKLKDNNGTVMHNRTDVDTKQRAIRAIEIEEFILKEQRGEGTLKSPAEGKGKEESKPYGVLAASVIERGEQGSRYNGVVIGIDIDRDTRRQRITQRLKQRLEDGMVDEVQQLLNEGCTPQQLIYYGLEYRYITQYIIGQLSYQQMVSQLEIAIHQFAKRQMTYFRGMQRRGTHIQWIDYAIPTEDKVKLIINTIHSS